jgi:hypothetical protein
MQEEDCKESSLSPAEITQATPPAGPPHTGGGGVHVKVGNCMSFGVGLRDHWQSQWHIVALKRSFLFNKCNTASTGTSAPRFG